MEGNTRSEKELLHILETEEEIRQALAGDMQQQIEDQKQEMENSLIALNDALRCLN